MSDLRPLTVTLRLQVPADWTDERVAEHLRGYIDDETAYDVDACEVGERAELDDDAHDALARIREWRSMPDTNSDREMQHRREEVRSYAVEFVNAVLRANPALRGGK